MNVHSNLFPKQIAVLDNDQVDAVVIMVGGQQWLILESVRRHKSVCPVKAFAHIAPHPPAWRQRMPFIWRLLLSLPSLPPASQTLSGSIYVGAAAGGDLEIQTRGMCSECHRECLIRLMIISKQTSTSCRILETNFFHFWLGQFDQS